MIKFDVFNRFSGAVQFTAEIEASDEDLRSVKFGLAVRWAVKNGANLYGAGLSGADLSCADLSGADLSRADLSGADLSGADLSCADLSRADLSDASLFGANLYCANLSRAYLSRADLFDASLFGAELSGADLSRAYLSCADLSDASLFGAELSGADLSRAYLSGANGLNDYLKCIQIDQYPITYTSDALQIGCERHAISDWADFDDHRIAKMDGKYALKFWRKYKAWIFQTIEMCPAKPTGYVKQEAET